jgi:hypothetical protein
LAEDKVKPPPRSVVVTSSTVNSATVNMPVKVIWPGTTASPEEVLIEATLSDPDTVYSGGSATSLSSSTSMPSSGEGDGASLGVTSQE